MPLIDDKENDLHPSPTTTFSVEEPESSYPHFFCSPSPSRYPSQPQRSSSYLTNYFENVAAADNAAWEASQRVAFETAREKSLCGLPSWEEREEGIGSGDEDVEGEGDGGAELRGKWDESGSEDGEEGGARLRISDEVIDRLMARHERARSIRSLSADVTQFTNTRPSKEAIQAAKVSLRAQTSTTSNSSNSSNSRRSKTYTPPPRTQARHHAAPVDSHSDNQLEYLTKLFSLTHLAPPDLTRFTPSTCARLSPVFMHDAAWINHHHHRQKAQSSCFSGIAMDFGWNCARYGALAMLGKVESEFGAERWMRANETYGGYDLRLQPAPMQLEGMDGMFERVFEGSWERGQWARRPGSWWGERKSVFDHRETRYVDHLGVIVVPCVQRGKSFEEWIDGRGDDIMKEVEKWAGGDGAPKHEVGFLTLKRKRGSEVWDRNGEEVDCRLRAKKAKNGGGRWCAKVMDEEWRDKRRQHEKRAGRWTDSTMAMHRLWECFHWVLNVDDPKDDVWVKKKGKLAVRDVKGSDIWGLEK